MRLIFLNIILFFTINLHAQYNFVHNGNFENIKSCPNTLNSIDLCYYWYNTTFGSSADLFNTCSSQSNPFSVNVPNNYFGYQSAVSGNGYIGFWQSVRLENSREYITGKFKTLLLKDSIYVLSFFVSTVDNSQYAIDRIGAYISNDSIFQNNDNVLPYTPQIESDSGIILDYRWSWHEIKGLYKAKGGEKYITLGCFVDTDSLNWKTYNPPINIGDGAYYYVDSVSIRLYQKPDTIIALKDPRYKLYPNPTSDIIKIDFKDLMPNSVELELYDIIGRKIFSKKSNIQGINFQANIQTLPSGVYAYKLKVDGDIFGRGKIIIFR